MKGFQQNKGVAFDVIFSLVIKIISFRAVLIIATSMDFEVDQLDVKMTFLHGDLEEEICRHHPEGFVEKGKENLVC